MTTYAISLEDVQDAARRLEGWVHRTPIMTCSTLDSRAGKAIVLKCENFQKVGAFKFRGACNAIALLDHGTSGRGVVTHSSGNHAQALALAARMSDIPAHIVMPRNAPAVKRRAVEGYGGKVYPCEPTLAAREEESQRLLTETGGILVPPYDHPHVMAGQGTIALELLEEAPRLDALIAPIGGGGLMSGLAVAAHGVNPSLRLFAAEPLGADDAARSFAARERVQLTAPKSIADGLLAGIGLLTWPIIRDRVERVITVTDEAIVEAMRLVWERVKIVIEPSAAVAVAAAFSPEFQAIKDVHRVGIVLSGGNVDLDRLPWQAN